MARGVAQVEEGALWVVDRRVAQLHPAVMRVIMRRRPLGVVSLRAGEQAKSFRALEVVCRAAQRLRRGGTLVCVGGGTLGDLSTVAAHLVKRGLSLVQVPSTLLAAVDSSVGGKGALNVGAVKNAVGVFHEPAFTLLCPELWETLSEAQRDEGALEAWKMVLTLDARAYRVWSSQGLPSPAAWVEKGRALKRAVCAVDPLETKGRRQVLNFGHTFGHVLESLSGYTVRHGQAVGLGMRCALDVGEQLGVTAPEVAAEARRSLSALAPPWSVAQRLFARVGIDEIAELLTADKKGDGSTTLTMVLLERPGQTTSVKVDAKVWKKSVMGWRSGKTTAA